MKTIIKKWWPWILFAIFLFIQFFRIDKSKSESNSADHLFEIVEISDDVKKSLEAACTDCHSYDTKYPWYAEIAPVSWWIAGHVKNGRKHFNLSEWGTYSDKKADHKLEECIEMLENKEMPLLSYMITHGNARLSADEREKMVDFFTGLRDKYQVE
jgi:hypothetical protein